MIKAARKSGLFLQVLLLLVGFVSGVLTASQLPADHAGPGYDVEMSRMIPLRDGVQLEGWIFKPSNLKTKVPTVFALTQYEIDSMREGKYFAKRGFVFCQVYVRGRG